MPVITFHNEHRSFEVEAGVNLRLAMLKLGVTPYAGLTILTNCRGNNFCGTCAVEIVDGNGTSPRSQDEEATLGGNLAIAKVVEKNVRLSCQTTIIADMVVKTHPSRQVDKQKTKERLGLLAVASFFLLTFVGMFAYLFFDMIKKF
jgi:ferredoxin